MARLGLLVFMVFSLAFAWFHIEIAYLLDVWGISGKTPAIAADKFTAIDRTQWKVHDVSSFEAAKDEGLPKNAWDGEWYVRFAGAAYGSVYGQEITGARVRDIVPEGLATHVLDD